MPQSCPDRYRTGVLFQQVSSFVFDSGFEAVVAGDTEAKRVLVVKGGLPGIVDKMPDMVDATDRERVCAHR